MGQLTKEQKDTFLNTKWNGDGTITVSFCRGTRQENITPVTEAIPSSCADDFLYIGKRENGEYDLFGFYTAEGLPDTEHYQAECWGDSDSECCPGDWLDLEQVAEGLQCVYNEEKGYWEIIEK